MGTKVIEQAFPGKKAEEIWSEAEKLLVRMGEKYGVKCTFDPARKTAVVPETMGVKGTCTVTDGHARVELVYGLLGTAAAGVVASYIEEKMKRLFA